MKKKLLKTVVEGIEPGPKDIICWDTEVSGFGVKVFPTGARVYILDYTTHEGRRRRMALGAHGVLDVAGARALAQEKLREVAHGQDPLQNKQQGRKAPTMAELCEEYLEKHARAHKKDRSVKDDETYITRFIKPTFGKLKAAALTRPDVIKLHDSLKDTPTTANRALACLSKMMNLAELWGYRPDGSNPCRHVKRFKEVKRKRFLSADEIAAVGAVLAEIENAPICKQSTRSCIAAVRLLLLTGCRMSEILNLKWIECDIEDGRIELEDSKTGARVVPLNGAAADVLRGLWARREERAKADKPVSEWVLAGRTKDEPLQWLESFWQKVRRKAGIPDVRLHDLRHTVGSVGAAEGLGLPIIGAVLGHSQAATTMRYAHVAASPALAASEIIGQRIGAALAGNVAKVVEVNASTPEAKEDSGAG